jgi:ATP-binding cassette subfamily B protein
MIFNKGNYPHYKQLDEKDCGPTCLKIICKYYNKLVSIKTIRELTYTDRTGSSMLGLSLASEKLGFKSMGAMVSYNQLQNEVLLPCVAHWNQNHFVVVFEVKNNKVIVSDPSHGILKYTKKEFVKGWNNSLYNGVILIVDPTQEFYNTSPDINSDEKIVIKWSSFLKQNLLVYKKYFFQLCVGLIISSILQLLFPILTQSIVDVGIKNKSVKFIYLILIAQLALYIGKVIIDLIRSWTLIYISSRINISLVSAYFRKLMNLPISFFDKKLTGDLTQRISDLNRIEQFITSGILNFTFSFFSLIILGMAISLYNLTIFAIFLMGSILYVLWIVIFMKKRADIDYKRFSQQSSNQSTIIEMINGMQEIKLNNAEHLKRWQWEKIQIKLYKIGLSSAYLSQAQNLGSGLINEIKNILITIYAAQLVIDNSISLGVMLSISYIIGQLNSPIIQLLSFLQSLQDANISMERLQEIHSKNDEEAKVMISNDSLTIENITIENLSFSYSGSSSEKIINAINLNIPKNKITAIVGASGSGKTTLMKLLLKFYEPVQGDIKIGNVPLNKISARWWRARCGVVMQEGYIFTDTIRKNITVGFENEDKVQLEHSIKLANLQELMAQLPLGLDTVIGPEGHGLSTGQKQRILIARAVYKNPEILFFDEATSALDSNNEKIIVENLNSFFHGKTVLMIAHRLSTVVNADQIIVLENGKVVERGNHKELLANQSWYYNLIRNQLNI